MSQMTTASIDDLPDADFGYIEPGGGTDPSGKTTPRSLRHFPLHDAAHVRDALSRAPQSPYGKEAMPKIEAAAKKFGVDTGDSSRGEHLAPALPYSRSFPLEDISVRSGGDGRTVEAYAAIFNAPAHVHDQDGEYMEEIDPTCFNRAIALANQSGRRIPVMFNHGMTLFGTPSELDSMPIGVTEEIRADKRGVFTRARYLCSDRADAALEAINQKAISAYSFSGAFNRSDPEVRRGQRLAADRRTGQLPTVRRMESTLREYGPTPFPVYSGAEVVGVRAEYAAMLLSRLDPDERRRLAELFASGTPLDPPDEGTPSDEGPAADDPPSGHSTRSVKEQIAVNRSEFNERLNIKQQLQANRARFTSRYGTTSKEGNQDG